MKFNSIQPNWEKNANKDIKKHEPCKLYKKKNANEMFDIKIELVFFVKLHVRDITFNL